MLNLLITGGCGFIASNFINYYFIKNESKLNKAKEITDKDVYFFWKLKDGLYYWKYKEGEYNIDLGGRTDRGKSEINRCAFINNEYIKNYNDLVLSN